MGINMAQDVLKSLEDFQITLERAAKVGKWVMDRKRV
jgi:hypothetical protein